MKYGQHANMAAVTHRDGDRLGSEPTTEDRGVQVEQARPASHDAAVLLGGRRRRHSFYSYGLYSRSLYSYGLFRHDLNYMVIAYKVTTYIEGDVESSMVSVVVSHLDAHISFANDIVLKVGICLRAKLLRPLWLRSV